MKKILLASTALVAFAGAAAAEVTISGSAELGIVGQKGAETRIHQDIDVNFKMSGETDSGLSFGAAVDLDEAGNLANTNDDQGVAIFISGDFGTVTVGDTDGAMDWALTEQNAGSPGSIDDVETSHRGWFGNFHDGQYDGQIVRYDNTFGDFGVAISFEMDDDATAAGTTLGTQTVGNGLTRDMGYAIGFKYNTELSGVNLAIGLGHQYIDTTEATTTGDQSITGLSIAATMDNGFSGVIVYTTGDIRAIADSNHLGLGAAYTTGAITVGFNYGKFDFGNNSTAEGYALNAAYDLGGGLKVLGAYGNSSTKANATAAKVETDAFSLGLAMSF